MVEKVASATALSKHEPTRPIDWRTFHRAQARAKSAEVYSADSTGRRNTLIWRWSDGGWAAAEEGP
jgi:hypothetical protein